MGSPSSRRIENPEAKFLGSDGNPWGVITTDNGVINPSRLRVLFGSSYHLRPTQPVGDRSHWLILFAIFEDFSVLTDWNIKGEAAYLFIGEPQVPSSDHRM